MAKAANLLDHPLATQFQFGTGIECSFLPHINVDQFEWTQHNRFWKEDLRVVAEELGAKALRYALPWHLIESKRGEYDWSVADERIAEFKRLGINVMMDVMHFGTPRWLDQAVGDPMFPEALESFTEQLVTRYRDTIHTWCPFNEPLVSALFSGDFGFWPPFSRKWRGYMPVLSRIVQGVNRSIRAIRRAMPEATVLLCDAVEHYKTRNKELQTEVQHRNLRRFVVLDLLFGRVDIDHPLHWWLTNYGMSEIDLEWFRGNPAVPDVIGMDYYPHSDWALEKVNDHVRQRRSENPAGLYTIASAYYNRYGLPLMVTETSIDGPQINREIWMDQILDHCKTLREEGVPMLGMIWWPLLDQIDWDGALTHRIGKIHEVGLYKLQREKDGTLSRSRTGMAEFFRQAATQGDERVGKLSYIADPVPSIDEQLPPLMGKEAPPIYAPHLRHGGAAMQPIDRGHGNGQEKVSAERMARMSDPVAGMGSAIAEAPSLAEEVAADSDVDDSSDLEVVETKSTGKYGIVVFSHLRWGFVWQRPQQFLSRFARKHQILFIEEPMFDLHEGAPLRLDYHGVMPNVTVVTPHCPHSFNKNPKLPAQLRAWAKEAIEAVNDDGAFDKPLHWYYSPMDSAWSLGHFTNRGVVYDCMDELSQFTGAPPQLLANERRLMEAADVMFTGGYELWTRKKEIHPNVHFFGCGVEFSHFNKAQEARTTIPADIDFMNRPILGWFGVVDERVDYAMVGEMARMKPEWTFAMVGPVVKVDPNLLPHSPNLYWLGGRDYQQLPHYCKAFDINMMCFAINAATQFINPTKGLEYMATGKPIVGTPVLDVVRQWSDIVHIAHNAHEFIGAAEYALDLNHPDRNARIAKGLALAKQNSWEGTVQRMQDLIKDAIAPEKRAGKPKVKPLPDQELGYLYQATQGS